MIFLNPNDILYGAHLRFDLKQYFIFFLYIKSYTLNNFFFFLQMLLYFVTFNFSYKNEIVKKYKLKRGDIFTPKNYHLPICFYFFDN